ncbi:MAG TPA: addiction module protein [Thermoanaerobaculia bacterium]|jgi:putative addiction module component (TIGR02574 family)|nr:addiction module protein [Thermoanaerobaculia bacterium]
MNSAVRIRLRSEALELSEPERAELAHDLVLSLAGPPDSQAAQEWDAELLRRMDEVEAGTAPLVDRLEFQRRMQERLSPKDPKSFPESSRWIS